MSLSFVSMLPSLISLVVGLFVGNYVRKNRLYEVAGKGLETWKSYAEGLEREVAELKKHIALLETKIQSLETAIKVLTDKPKATNPRKPRPRR